MILLPYLVVVSLLVLIQYSVRRAMGPSACIGDEVDYVRRGGATDPYAPGLFLRVPMMAWMSKQAHRFSSNPEWMLRSAAGVASATSIIACMMSAQILGGAPVMIFVGLLLLVMPGRVILSRHIWPDIWLGLWLSLSCLILVYPDLSSNFRAISLGLLASLAFITRFDALLLAPLSGFALAPLPIQGWVFILLPTLVAFAWLSARNARRYQIPWPDTTWMFNVAIAAGETEKKAGKVKVEQEIIEVVGVWNKLDEPGRLSSGLAGIRKLFARPLRTFSGVLMKVWASLGPDSFVMHRLLPPDGVAYPEISAGINRGLKIALTLAFPVFTSMMVLALLVSEASTSIVVWPTLAVAAATLIHNRTRYRQAWLPGAAVLLASALSSPGFWPRLLSRESIAAWAIAIVLAIALIRFRVRLDKREDL